MEMTDKLLELLINHKQQMETDDEELRLEMLLEFLHTSRNIKEKSLLDKRSHLQHITSDLSVVRTQITDTVTPPPCKHLRAPCLPSAPRSAPVPLPCRGGRTHGGGGQTRCRG